MNSRRHREQEFEEAGSTSERLNIDSVGFDTFLTKGADQGMIFELGGMDVTGHTVAEAARVKRTIQTAIRTIGAGEFSVYTVLVKRSHPDISDTRYENPVIDEAMRLRREYLLSKGNQLYSFRLYAVIVHRNGHKLNTNNNKKNKLWKRIRSKISRTFLASAYSSELGNELQASVDKLREVADGFVSQIQEVTSVRVLNKEELFSFFRSLLNPEPQIADQMGLKCDWAVAEQISESEIEVHRNFLRVADHFVGVLTLKEPPDETEANILSAIQRIPADFVLINEWQLIDPLQARREMRLAQIHQHNAIRWVTASGGRDGGTEPLINRTKVALVEELGEALRRLETEGLQFCDFSSSIVTYSKTIEESNRTKALLRREFGKRNGILHPESYNLLNAFFAAIPGGFHDNFRYMRLSLENVADLFPLFIPSRGHPVDAHLGAEAAFLFETADQTLYHYTLFFEGVGNAFLLGTTGSGKTFLLQSLILEFQKYSPFTFIFDLGGGYETLTKLCGGSHIKIGMDKCPFSIGPFAGEPTKEKLQFLFVFTKSLIESDGGPRMTRAEDDDLYSEIESLYVLPPKLRRLQTVASGVSANLRSRLQPWVGKGRNSTWFDNAEDTFTLATFQSVDLEGMDRYQEILEPLLLYLIYSITVVVSDPRNLGRLKIGAVDEAWRFLKNPTVRDYVTEALKTWRKKNAAMFLATQSTEDLRETEMVRHVVECCPTKFFLVNRKLDEPAYREICGLNEPQITCIKDFQIGDVLLTRGSETKHLRHTVDRRRYMLLTSDPLEVKRRNELIQEIGLNAALDELAKEQ